MTHQSWINAYETQIQIQNDQMIFSGLFEKKIFKNLKFSDFI